ncbi:hypothetical protein EF849_15620 [Aeromonas jandaei]|nr:hypothetical protein [Aeromonas jandaei]
MHNVVAVAGGTNACWQGSGKSAKRVLSVIDTEVKKRSLGSVFVMCCRQIRPAFPIANGLMPHIPKEQMP